MAVQERDQNVKNEARHRDNTTCQKCGQRQRDIHGHHIIPLRVGGPDTVENIITLCQSCHLEWESLTAAYQDGFSFAMWMKLPPWASLISLFTGEQGWPTTISAAEMRDLILHSGAFEILRGVRASEPRKYEPEYVDDEGNEGPRSRWAEAKARRNSMDDSD